MTPELSPTQVLNLPLDPNDNDSSATTIHGYLIELLSALWAEGEGFSGKRPIGNSGWEFQLYKPLITAGVINGQVDEDGYIEDVDTTAGDSVIAAAIQALGPTGA